MINFFDVFSMEQQRAICYSGFREGQQPGAVYPSYDEVKEDLLLLQPHCRYLRLYDCDTHAETVLNVIQQEGFDFKIMLGAYTEAEMNNFGCPWGGGVYEQSILDNNKQKNQKKIERLIELSQQFPKIIFSLSGGNEACVDWTDHYIPVERVISFVKKIKHYADQPVSFCENYLPWLHQLAPLVPYVDFISIHTYPVWEYKQIHDALQYTMQNFSMVANAYPEKTVVITEAGWATNSNGRGINPEHVNEVNQMIYFNDLMQWTDKEKILTFFFEAFDEPWKGSPEPMEPEKHWGLFKKDRLPKLVMQNITVKDPY